MADRQTQQIIGYVFLGLMVLFLILAINQSEDNLWMLLIAAVIFLAVGLSLLGTSGGGVGSDGGQQQSVVMGGGRTHVQSSSAGVLTLCGKCDARVSDSHKFCPECGKALS